MLWDTHAGHACRLPSCCGEKVSLGFIADVSQPARHHDIEQMYRQRTRQYKVELKKLEALAAKERERLLAEERAHARRLAATGEAAGGADDQACIIVLLAFRRLHINPTVIVSACCRRTGKSGVVLFEYENLPQALASGILMGDKHSVNHGFPHAHFALNVRCVCHVRVCQP